MNTFAFLEKSARQRPDGLALVQGVEQITYREFHERALTIGGNLLAAGCVPGDRIAFCLANSPRILELIFGCLAAGLVVVPVNARLHAREMAYIVGNSGARALVYGAEYHDGIVAHASLFEGVKRICTAPVADAEPFSKLLDPAHALVCAVDARPEDLCWLFYTSGTTGKPKGAMWNHRMVARVIMNYLADLHNIQPGEVVLHCAPLSHGSGTYLPAIGLSALGWLGIGMTASFRATRRPVATWRDFWREYLWLGGPGVSHASDPGSDTDAYDAGFASITPLVLDLSATDDNGVADKVIAAASAIG